MRFALHLCWCAALAWALPGYGQVLPSGVALGRAEGLPSTTVYHILQDREGYLWFATDNGVARFNGTSFQTFNHTHGLADNSVVRLHQDSQGRVWFLSLSGKLTYWRAGQVYSAANDSLVARINASMNQTVYCAAEDRAGNLLFGLPNNQYARIGPDGQVKFQHVTSLGIPKVINFHTDPAGRLWAQLSEGQMLDVETSEIVTPSPELFPVPRGSLWRSEISPDGRRVLLANPQGVVGWFLFDGSSFSPITGAERVSNFNGGGPTINALSFRTPNELWASTSNGLHIYQGFGTPALNIHTLLSGQNVSFVLKDRDGNLWVSTLGKGVYCYPAHGFQSVGMGSGAPMEPISALYNDPAGHVWVGLNNGEIYRQADGRWTFYDIVPNGISPCKIYGFMQISPDTLVVYTERGRAGFHNGRCFFVDIKVQYAGRKSAVRLPNGTVVESTGQNLGWWKYYDVFVPNDQSRSIGMWMRTARIHSQFCDREGRLWLGTSDGVVMFSQDQMDTLWTHTPELTAQVTAFAQDAQGRIWMATKADGVLCWQSSGTVTQYTTLQGLSSDVCRDVEIDATGSVWVATDIGLDRLRFGSQFQGGFHIRQYSALDGLSSDEINVLQVAGNQLYIGSNQGLFVLNINNESPGGGPSVFISGIEVNQSPIPMEASLELQPGSTDIRVLFLSLSLSSLGRMRYRLRLEGADNGWQETSDPYVRFNNLAPGNYTLTVYALDPEGRQSATPATLSITLLPPVWRRWWFLALCGFVVLALGFGLYKWRVRVVRRQAAFMRRLSETRYNALVSQMNPHFIFNSLNSIHNVVLQQRNEEATAQLLLFARLVRILLNHSRESSVLLAHETEALDLYLQLEQKRLGEKLTWRIEVGPGIEPNLAEVPPLMVQPLVENAVWHGISPSREGGEVRISFERRGPEYLLCTVEDNGVGRRPKLPGEDPTQPSLGLKLMQERIDLLNEKYGTHLSISITDLINEDNMPTGTRVEVLMPDLSLF